MARFRSIKSHPRSYQEVVGPVITYVDSFLCDRVCARAIVRNTISSAWRPTSSPSAAIHNSCSGSNSSSMESSSNSQRSYLSIQIGISAQQISCFYLSAHFDSPIK